MTDLMDLRAEIARLTRDRDELQAKVNWLTDVPNMCGWPWDSPFNDGYDTAKDEFLKDNERLTRERDEARENRDNISRQAATELKRLRAALRDLLEDTQHKHHNCGDDWCPVKKARAALEVK